MQKSAVTFEEKTISGSASGQDWKPDFKSRAHGTFYHIFHCFLYFRTSVWCAVKKVTFKPLINPNEVIWSVCMCTHFWCLFLWDSVIHSKHCNVSPGSRYWIHANWDYRLWGPQSWQRLPEKYAQGTCFFFFFYTCCSWKYSQFYDNLPFPSASVSIVMRCKNVPW